MRCPSGLRSTDFDRVVLSGWIKQTKTARRFPDWCDEQRQTGCVRNWSHHSRGICSPAISLCRSREQRLSTTDDRGLSLGDDVACRCQARRPRRRIFNRFLCRRIPRSSGRIPRAKHSPAASDRLTVAGLLATTVFARSVSALDGQRCYRRHHRQLRIVRPSTTDDSPPARRNRYHTIHDGDTLESLALRYYDDAKKSRLDSSANPAILAVPGLLPVGQEIVISDGTQLPAAGRLRAATDTAVDPDADSVAETLVPLPERLLSTITVRTGGKDNFWTLLVVPFASRIFRGERRLCYSCDPKRRSWRVASVINHSQTDLSGPATAGILLS